ncbi:YqaE/Pmp3 family membrane protein PWA37_001014 [Arxiozyma heterogenica]|uniref:Uncharacterized protein n=1 Tax=Arxiozyma heterogenica TaxID=278026 RepID=A0AAN7WGV3_9SACH|nr:hypothetical protein RI543_002921 [Kazachstania heterogenica]
MQSHVYSVNKDDLILIVLSIFIPPVAVIIRKGFFSRDFLLNLLLFLIFFFPAIIHAFYVIYETSTQRPYNNTNGSSTTVSISNVVATEDQLPLASNVDGLNNGNFNIDLERDGNKGDLPNYEEVAGHKHVTDNKIQH